MYNAILIDFDGTLTKFDVLDYLVKFINRKYDNRTQNKKNNLKGNLIKKISCLHGVKISDVTNLLGNHLMRDGYDFFVNKLKISNLELMIMTGNICPVVKYFESQINAKKIFCTVTKIINGRISIVEIDDIKKDSKIITNYLKENDINPSELIAVGNDSSDIPFFKMAGCSISFNGNSDTIKYATHSISGDLIDLISLIEKIQKENKN